MIKLGAGFCGEAGSITCDSSFRKTDPLSVPLNLEVGGAGDLVSVDSASELDLGYKAKATLEIGIPLKLGIPVPTIVDTTSLQLEGSAAVDPINLSAGIGPLQVDIGAAIADKDPADGEPVPGVGKAKVGAKFSFGRGDEDGIPGNRTYDFAGGNSFFTGSGGLDATFEGVDQDCGGSTSGGANDDACLVADLAVEPLPGYLGDIVLSCDIQPLPAAPTCATPTGVAYDALQDAINGQPLNFALLIQLLPQLLNDLEHSLSGAAQDVELPLVGEALDAGAGIVDTFNQGVVVPFASLAAEIQAAVDTDGDGVEPAEAAAKVQKAIWDLIGPSGSVQLGGQPANLILDLNGTGDPATIDDVVVVALCGDTPDRCADGEQITAIDDFRITVKLGQSLNKNVPFDLGLDGVPLSLQGGLKAGVGWSLLLDFGLSRDGPYLVKSGPQSVTGPLAGVTGDDNENEVNMPFNADGGDEDELPERRVGAGRLPARPGRPLPRERRGRLLAEERLEEHGLPDHQGRGHEAPLRELRRHAGNPVDADRRDGRRRVPDRHAARARRRRSRRRARARRDRRARLRPGARRDVRDRSRRPARNAGGPRRALLGRRHRGWAGQVPPGEGRLPDRHRARQDQRRQLPGQP